MVYLFANLVTLGLHDGVPTLAARWSTLLSWGPVIGATLWGLAVACLLWRAPETRRFVRRLGWAFAGLGGLGLAVADFLFLLPNKASIHPGRDSAGDVGPLLVLAIPFVFGLVAWAVAALLLVGSAIRLRRRT